MKSDDRPSGSLAEKSDIAESGKTAKASARAFLYDSQSFGETDPGDLAAPEGKCLWVHVDGLDAVLIKEVGLHFGLHPLVVEDILNPAERPSLQDYGDYLFFIVKFVDFPLKKRYTEQLSFIIGNNYVFSVQESPGDPFDTVYERLKNNRGLIRQMGPDSLGHALFDTAIDNSLLAMHKVQEKIDAMEDAMINNPSNKLLHGVHQLRRSLLTLPRTLRSQADMASACERGEYRLISPGLKPYFRDLRDHLNTILDMTEVSRSILSGILDLYLSSVNNRMNEVMKTLTIISTIFIPLSFLAGVYGMNFKYMPELLWEWGYPIFWGTAALIVFGMLYFFKKKKWI